MQDLYLRMRSSCPAFQRRRKRCLWPGLPLNRHIHLRYPHLLCGLAHSWKLFSSHNQRKSSDTSFQIPQLTDPAGGSTSFSSVPASNVGGISSPVDVRPLETQEAASHALHEEHAPLHRRLSSSWHGSSLLNPPSPELYQQHQVQGGQGEGQHQEEDLHQQSLTDAPCSKPMAASWHGAGRGQAEPSCQVSGQVDSWGDERFSGPVTEGASGASPAPSAPGLAICPPQIAREAFVGWPRAVVVHSELRTEAGFAGVLHE